MTRRDEILFALLRAGLCTQAPTPGEAIPSATNFREEGHPIDWAAVYAAAAAHGVLAIAWDGLERMIASGAIEPPCQPSRPLKLQWALNTARIETRQRKQREAAFRLGRLLEAEGIRALVFKGLSLSLCYPVPLHRECGDIDIYALAGAYERVGALAAGDSASKPFVSAKHAEFSYAGANFENHRLLRSEFLSPRNRRINRDLEAALAQAEPLPGSRTLLRPGYRFDELFIAAHAAAHFASEGIALRHVADWMLLLRANDRQPDMQRLRAFGLDRFAAILNRICREHLGLDLPESICLCDRAVYERVLNDILAQGHAATAKSRWELLQRKVRRFTGRRWAYPLVGGSFASALARSICAHATQPVFFFRGNK